MHSHNDLSNSRIIQIVRIADNAIRICGLNMLEANGVVLPIEQRPTYMFIKHMTDHHGGTTILGGLALSDFEQEEISMLSSNANNTSLSIHNGTFYIEDDYGSKLADAKSIFSRNPPPRILMYLISYGALALGIPSAVGNLCDEHICLANTMDVDSYSAYIIRHLLTSFDILIICGHDGLYLDIYATNDEMIFLTEAAIDHIVQIMAATDWYKTNKQYLVWDDEYDTCLKLIDTNKPMRLSQK